ncbi:MAG: 3-keto-5-aminohexanoate cleavage protein [Oscillospiraceae bacterium]
MEKLIITAAICGAEVTKEQNPAVPYTVDEMVREAKSAYEAGAPSCTSMSVRMTARPPRAVSASSVVMDAIRKELPDVIMIPSTGGAAGMTPEERLQPTELFPEMATLDCGTCNFGDEIFDNTMPTMRAFGKRMLENNIKPEYECFELGHIDTILGMAKKGEVPAHPMQFNFVLGVHGCTPATVENLAFFASKIPAGSTWTVSGVGRSAWTMAAAAIAMGGNVRVGFEDNIYLGKGQKAASNGELVAKVVRIAKELGREIATPAEAREILSLKPLK